MALLESVVDINIEYAHLYAANLERDIKSLENGVQKAREIIDLADRQRLTHSSTVLVDDYSIGSTEVDIKKILLILESLRLAPDYVVLESEMVANVTYFLQFLPQKNLIRETDRVVYHSAGLDANLEQTALPARRYKSIFMERAKRSGGSENQMTGRQVLSLQQHRIHSESSIVLAVGEGASVRYSCPLLTACWYLIRLGVEPFYSPILYRRRNAPSFVGRRLVTVLPLDYLKVEATAVELLSLSKTKAISKCKKRISYFFH